jgi:hypothetical protein
MAIFFYYYWLSQYQIWAKVSIGNTYVFTGQNQLKKGFFDTSLSKMKKSV